MKIDWEMQRTCTRPDLVFPRPNTIAEARRRLIQYLNQREEREKTLKEVVTGYGRTFSKGREGVLEITRFYLEHITSNVDGTELSIDWVEFIWNFGQFIGFQLIDLAPSGKLRWVVENIAVRSAPPRFVFRIYGYAGASESFDPDRLLLDIGRAKISGEEVSDLIIVAHMNRILRLCNERPQ